MMLADKMEKVMPQQMARAIHFNSHTDSWGAYFTPIVMSRDMVLRPRMLRSPLLQA